MLLAACCLLNTTQLARGQDPDLEVIDNFNSGAEGWQIYDYDGGQSGNVFYPVTWENSGGVGNSGYVWGDDSRWRIDTPENPDSILSFIVYRSWVGESSLDLRDAELSFYLRGDNLDLKGGNIYFWVLNSEPYGHRWHLTSEPLQITEGAWGAKQTVTLFNDPTKWHRSWTRSPLVPGTINDILSNVESYGFSFVGFSEEVTGKFSMDELELRAPISLPQPGVFRWQTSSLGDWSAGSNWDWESPPTVDASVVFGAEATLPTTVVTNGAVTAKSLRFDNSQSFALSGSGSVTLAADEGQAAIEVTQGSHQLQTELNLLADTEINIASGAHLAFNNVLRLNGHTLTKSGDGIVEINHALVLDGGTVNGIEGMIGGSGAIGSDLFNTGATIAPGLEGPASFSVAGDYTQLSHGTIEIEIGGRAAAVEYDQLAVGGQALLDGQLVVSLLDMGDGFEPTVNDRFTILNATGGIAGRFTTLPADLPALASGLAWRIDYAANEVALSVVSVPEPGCILLALTASMMLCNRRQTTR